MNAQPRPLIIVAVLIVFVVIVGLLVVYLPLPEGIRSWLNVVFAPQEVRSHAYLGVEDGKGVVYELGATGIEKRSFEGFSIVDYVRTEKAEVGILRNSEGEYDVYALDGQTATALTTDGRPKIALSVSLDGAYLAYSVFARNLPAPKNMPEGEVAYSLAEWDVETILLSTGENTLIGGGNHPHFYKDGLFYLAPEGFTYRIPGDNGFDTLDSKSIIPDTSVFRIMRVADFTDEGVFIFPSVATLVYEELSIASVKPLAFGSVTKTPPRVPAETIDMQILSKDSRLVLMQVEGGRVALYKMKGEELKPFFTFPSDYQPRRFLDIE